MLLLASDESVAVSSCLCVGGVEWFFLLFPAFPFFLSAKTNEFVQLFARGLAVGRSVGRFYYRFKLYDNYEN